MGGRVWRMRRWSRKGNSVIAWPLPGRLCCNRKAWRRVNSRFRGNGVWSVTPWCRSSRLPIWGFLEIWNNPPLVRYVTSRNLPPCTRSPECLRHRELFVNHAIVLHPCLPISRVGKERVVRVQVPTPKRSGVNRPHPTVLLLQRQRVKLKPPYLPAAGI